MVIGFSEEEWVEFQMEGVIKKLERSDSNEKIEVFASKFSGATLKDDHIVLKFTSTWWRYTEFRPKPPKIISSEN